MKVLEICPFSSGIDGVFSRVIQESALLAKRKHKVEIFSTNIVKGSLNLADKHENKEGVVIRRFSDESDIFDKILSRNVTYFNFKEEFKEFKPDLVITHLIHPHSFEALKLCKRYNIPCYLVTHAPFAVKRNFLLSLATKTYYLIKVKRKIKMFDKIIAISHWEMPYLSKLGIDKDKIEYIPNGIAKEFFSQKKSREENKILFLGRISPVKSLETLIKAIPLIKDKKIKIDVTGMAEETYLKNLKELAKKLKVENRIMFNEPIFDLRDKIRKIDSCKIFVLPSIREGMPQSLIEAMSRKKIVIASNNFGSKDLINDGENGYLFEIGDEKELARKINNCNIKVKENAYKSVKAFNWDKIIDKLEKTIS